MIVADSDVLIDALRGRQPAARRVAELLKSGSLATTAISVFELLSGAKRPAERTKVERLLGPLVVLPFDDRAGLAAAEARRTMETSGAGIGIADYLIAGICLARSATLFTRNRDHFQRVPGLTLL